MEILALSCNGESNGPQMSTGTNFMCNGESTEHEKQVQASDVTNEVDNILQNEGDKPGEDPRVLSEVPNSESICAQTSNCKNTVEEKESPCSLNAEKQVNESCSVVDIPFNVDKCGGELPTSTKDGESHLQEDQWLDQKETPAKQVGETCTEVDIPFNVENIGGKLPSSTRDGESQLQEAQWLDQEETVALWVKVSCNVYFFHY